MNWYIICDVILAGDLPQKGFPADKQHDMGTPAGSTPAPEHWGLDPMLRSYVRLFVCDVQSLTVYDFDQGEVQPSATSAISAGTLIVLLNCSNLL